MIRRHWEPDHIYGGNEVVLTGTQLNTLADYARALDSGKGDLRWDAVADEVVASVVAQLVDDIMGEASCYRINVWHPDYVDYDEHGPIRNVFTVLDVTWRGGEITTVSDAMLGDLIEWTTPHEKWGEAGNAWESILGDMVSAGVGDAEECNEALVRVATALDAWEWGHLGWSVDPIPHIDGPYQMTDQWGSWPDDEEEEN